MIKDIRKGLWPFYAIQLFRAISTFTKHVKVIRGFYPQQTTIRKGKFSNNVHSRACER